MIVVDLNRDGWSSVTGDAAGIVAELAELQPELLARVPLIAYHNSVGLWGALSVDPKGAFAGFIAIGAASQAEAVAWALLRNV